MIGILSIALVGVGMSSSFTNVPIITLLQKTTEDSKRGRVMSMVNMGAMAAMPLAYGFSGFLLEQVGAIPLILGIGAITAIGSTACFRSREIMAAQ